MTELENTSGANSTVPKAAIVVAVYNVEEFLEECLKSLRAQTEHDIEIICVNDCSPDGSAAILERMSGEDPRIRIINHPENRGLGAARKTGVESAKAPFFTFVDSDDFVGETMIADMLKIMDGGKVDMAWAGMARTTEAGVKLDDSEIPASTWTVEQVLNEKRLYPEILPLCGKMFKTELFRDIEQPSIVHEDQPPMADYLLKCSTIQTVSETYYFYRTRSNTLSLPSNITPKLWDDFFTAHGTFIEKLRGKFSDEALRKQIILRHFSLLWRIDSFNQLAADNWEEQRARLIQHLQEDKMKLATANGVFHRFLLRWLKKGHSAKSRKNLMKMGLRLSRTKWLERDSRINYPFDFLKFFYPMFKTKVLKGLDSLEIKFYRALAKVYKLFVRKDIWIVGERSDTAQENGIYFFRYLQENQPQEKCFYPIDPNCEPAKEVAKVGPTLKFNGFWHKLLFCASKYYVTSHNHYCKPLASFGKTRYAFSPQTENVFLDHGITYADVSEFYGKAASGIDLFICGAKPEYDFVGPGFGYKPEEVAYAGFARFDGLHDFEVKRQILVMPTWRRDIYENKIGNNHDYFRDSDYFKTFQRLISDPGLLSELDKHDYQLVFYPHYEIQHYLNQWQSENPRVILASKDEYTVQQLLKDAALLVVDTSSVNFDFAYMFKPLIYYRFDKKSFTSGHLKPGYFVHETMGFGEIVEEHEELIPLIKNYLETGCQMSDEYRRRTEEFYPLHDTKNCERIYHASLKKGAHGK